MLATARTTRLDGVSPQNQAVALTTRSASGRDHLLLYAFSYTDPEFLHNLEYFVKEAVVGDTVADTIIIVQEGPGLQVSWYAAAVEHDGGCLLCSRTPVAAM